MFFKHGKIMSSIMTLILGLQRCQNFVDSPVFMFDNVFRRLPTQLERIKIARSFYVTC